MGVTGSSGVTQVSGNVDTKINTGTPGADGTNASGTTVNDTFTVPVGKKWNVKYLALNRVNGGTLSVMAGGVYLFRMFTGTYLQWDRQVDIWLNAGETINFSGGAAASGQNQSNILYVEFDE